MLCNMSPSIPLVFPASSSLTLYLLSFTDLIRLKIWKHRLITHSAFSQEEHQKEIKSLQAIVEELKSEQEEAKLRLVRRNPFFVIIGELKGIRIYRSHLYFFRIYGHFFL